MIKGFRFIACSSLGEYELERELVSIDLNRKISEKSPFKLKHIIKLKVINDEDLIVEITFRNLFLKLIDKSGLTEDSEAIINAKKEFIKDLNCVEEKDYTFEIMR